MFKRNGKFAFTKKDQKRMWKEHIKKMIRDYTDQKTEIGIVKGPLEKVSLGEVTSAMKKRKLEKPPGLSEVNMNM